jgi:DNA recombination protein RmuC
MPADPLAIVTVVLVVVALVLLGLLVARPAPAAPPPPDLAPLRDELARTRQELAAALRDQRTELAGAQGTARTEQAQALEQLRAAVGQQLEATRATLEQKVAELTATNEQKLEQVRLTVDEKLHATLEQRLGQSFEQVTTRLLEVQKGLGEMQALATGVGDLKKVLTNVKARGVFGELQLAAILEQVLTPDQYVANWAPHADAGDRVEFAVRFPGKGGPDSAVFLPIDAKFPQEDYQRLLAAYDAGDADAVRTARTALSRSVLGYADYVREKYVVPPRTTDFGIVFLPTEGLYAEVLRQPGLIEGLQQRGVSLAGPTTLAAMLTALRLGFRTLAIEQRSAEVWQLLGAVKVEFAKFGDVIEKAQAQIQRAQNTLNDTGKRSRAMARKLREVEALPGTQAAELLALAPGEEPGDDGDAA